MEALDVLDFMNAFLRLASDPFRLARKPGVEPIDVPFVTREEDDPLLNWPRRLSEVPIAYEAGALGR
jgi:hypothetical protein